jgi:hypothetical protein
MFGRACTATRSAGRAGNVPQISSTPRPVCGGGGKSRCGFRGRRRVDRRNDRQPRHPLERHHVFANVAAFPRRRRAVGHNCSARACDVGAHAVLDRLAAETTSARKLIDHLDQAILAKAFRGELAPQDPNDEPASALLERIRASRQVAPAQGARKGARA